MSESNPASEVTPQSDAPLSVAADCQSPPPAPRAINADADPRADLLRLADVLTRTRSRHVLIEYLRLRRALA